MMVPAGGLEPPHLSAGDFESPLSTNSNTQAQIFYPDIVITRLSRLNNQQHFNYINSLYLKAINFESVVYTNFTIPALSWGIALSMFGIIRMRTDVASIKT